MKILLSPYFLVTLSSVLCVGLWIQWKIKNKLDFLIAFVGCAVFGLFYMAVGGLGMSADTSRLVGRWVFSFILCLFIIWVFMKFDIRKIKSFFRRVLRWRN